MESYMAEESQEISRVTVIGIGVVLFVIIVGVWFLFLK
jgi:uncharacterized membrane protein